MILKNVIRFVVLLLVQVLILNQINFSGFMNPYLYVLFILLLPFEIPGWLLLMLAFVMGLSVDLFSGTAGMNAAACVLMAFARPGVITLLSSGKDFEANLKPTIKEMGFGWFFMYSLILVFIHHLLLFYLEVFRFSEFFITFLRVILSTALTLALIILTQYLFDPGKPER